MNLAALQNMVILKFMPLSQHGRSLSAYRQKRFYGLCAGLVIALIAYGSLYPFVFRKGLHQLGPFQTLISTWRVLGPRADLIENILLYVPLGLSLYAFVSGSYSARLLFAGFGGFALCLTIEIAQYYDLGRDTSMSDVYANTVGALAGALAALVLSRHSIGPLAGLRRHPYCTLLLVCWLGYQLFPYVPAMSFEKYGNSIRSATHFSTLPISLLYRSFANWLAVSFLLEEVFDEINSRSTMILFSLIFAAKIVIADNFPSPADVAGGIIAIVIWSSFLSRSRHRALIVLGLFVGSVVLLQVQSGHGGSPAFNWIPLRFFLNRPISIVVPLFLEKTFTYGALVWLAVRVGIRVGISTILGAGLLLCLTLTGSADITDALILVGLAGFMRYVQSHTSARTSTGP